jgi:hypothetical protein
LQGRVDPTLTLPKTQGRGPERKKPILVREEGSSEREGFSLLFDGGKLTSRGPHPNPDLAKGRGPEVKNPLLSGRKGFQNVRVLAYFLMLTGIGYHGANFGAEALET